MGVLRQGFSRVPWCFRAPRGPAKSLCHERTLSPDHLRQNGQLIGLLDAKKEPKLLAQNTSSACDVMLPRIKQVRSSLGDRGHGVWYPVGQRLNSLFCRNRALLPWLGPIVTHECISKEQEARVAIVSVGNSCRAPFVYSHMPLSVRVKQGTCVLK